MRTRNRRIARVSFWATVALVFIGLLFAPLLFPYLYIITLPVAWNYGKYLKDNYNKIYDEMAN